MVTLPDDVVGTIYGLHSGDGEIRYVGKSGDNPDSRMDQHRHNAHRGDRTPVYDWIRSYGTRNIKMAVLETFTEDTVHTIDDRERFLIEDGKATGLRLTNISFGGDGGPHSEETKKNISSGMKAHYARKGGGHSEETKERMRFAAHTRHHLNKSVVKDGCNFCISRT